MTTDIGHVLFQCTGNFGRSMMAKADLVGAEKFTAHSAGSMPAPSPRPNTLDFRTKLSCIAGLALFSSWGYGSRTRRICNLVPFNLPIGSSDPMTLQPTINKLSGAGVVPKPTNP